MNKQTRNQLELLFLQTSRGAARKKIYALRAQQDGNNALATLFQAIAISEEAQARRFLLQLRGQIQKTTINARGAFEEEIPELIEQYKQAEEIARKEKERAMAAAFSQSARVEQMHQNLYKKLSEDTQKRSYHICSFCGFIKEGNKPDRCPICTAAASRFVSC